MIRSSILLVLLYPLLSVHAVSKDLIYEACLREPTLSFCDAHYFGKPLFDRPVTTTTTTPSPVVDDVFKEMNSWLEGYKDDTDDEDAQIEKSRRLHADKNQYCNKYQQNFKHYCLNGKDGQGVLEGVLNQFCAAYRIACDGVVDGVKSEVAEFPEPPDLEEDFEVDEGKAASPKSDKTEEYCKQFKAQYKALCFPPYKHAGEFCQSFNENCMEDPTSSETTPTPKQEGFVEETSPEGAGAESGSKITVYCEKYSENFNYYCIGDTAGTNEKFCRSYRKNCPGKIGS